MRKSAKIVTALSVAGLAVAAGSAFTGGGLTAAGQASNDQFVGGKVSQGITGATLTSVNYTFQDDTKRAIQTATLTFDADALGKNVAIDFTATTDADYTCTDVALAVDTYTSTCSPNDTLAADVTNAAITVS